MSDARHLLRQLALPAIVAPMFLVSSPALVLAACAEGIIGSFPAHSTRTRELFRQWLVEIEDGLAGLRVAEPGRRIAPYAVNLVTHASNDRLEGDMALCVEHRVPVVLTSKSAPSGVVQRVQAYGGIVLHDVATRRHAQKALEAGVDGLIVVSQGAGGHTGTINPFALMNELRTFYDGPIALAGCISTGRDVLAAQAMGADFAYIGTRFIATHESLASTGYKQMLVADSAVDVFFTASLDGAPCNFLTRSLLEAGIDLDALRTTLPGTVVSSKETAKKWRDIWSAGQGVGSVGGIVPARVLARQLKTEYAAAVQDFRARLAADRQEAA